MNRPFTLYGSEMSPYSHKVRSWFRYKGAPHRWIPSGPGSSDPGYRGHARLPIVPTLVWPDEEKAEQDSTPIIEGLEPSYPEPAIQPPGVLLGFLSTLIEEFGDEWGNKLMFHLRWYADIDVAASSDRAARLNMTGADEPTVAARATAVRERMAERGRFVGSSPATAPLIFDYFVELLDLLQPHLEGRCFLLGARPSFGDFALAAQLYHAASDPTGGAVMRARAPAVLDWCFRMVDPRDGGPFEALPTLAPTLDPLLAYIGRYFLPWSQANAEALARGAAEFSVELAGRLYVQPPQKYHAKSLAALREKYRSVKDDRELAAVLEAAGCTPFLV
ncbi:glutathione S-transferase family protein [Phenylobacterium sp. LjRoot164]|uniref:glutathione S-transferase family protein n=1 Tax=unclassified Phenylobacterium TaxID=2640670 RepID=UPI003ED15553